MTASLRVVALLAFLQSAAEGHKSSSILVETALAENEPSTGQFRAIQSELVNAWKQKSHMQKLRQTLEAEEKLLTSQQSLAEVKLDSESSAAEGQQVSATAAMIRDAKILLRNSRRDALGKTKKALQEAHEVKKAAEQQIEESSAEIARATKAKEEAVQKKQQIDTVIHAATEEAKYFFNQEVPQLQQGAQDSMGQKVNADSSATVTGKAEQAKETEKVVEKREAAKPQQKHVVSLQQAKAKEQQAQEEKDKQFSEQLDAELKKQEYQQKTKKTGGLPEALLQRSALKTTKDQQATKKASRPAKALVLLETQNADFNTSPPLDVLDEQMDEMSEEVNSASAD